MKRCKISLLSLVIFALALADGEKKLHKVHSFVKVLKTNEWYDNQRTLWNEEIKENPANENAWLNYYRATRNLKAIAGSYNQDDLDKIVRDASKNIPNTYVYHFIAYYNALDKETDESKHHLKKIMELENGQTEHLPDIFSYYEVRRDRENATKAAKNWFSTNDIAPGMYAWNYNQLQSTDEDAILLTVGDNDTYPSLILQYAQNIRTDVSVINTFLIRKDNYRETYFKELGLPQMKKFKEYGSSQAFLTAFLKHLNNHTDRPIYFTIGMSRDVYADFEDDLYNVGLAYEWCEKKFDNIAVIKRNVEKRFLMDYLEVPLRNELSQSVLDYMNGNYLIPFLTLYTHYKESDDPKADRLKKVILDIAKKNNAEQQAFRILEEDVNYELHSVTNPRLIEDYFVKIEDNMYAMTTEVTNELYDMFLVDLLKNKKYDDLEIAKANKIDWVDLAIKEGLTDDESILFKHAHPNDPKSPVVNISHEASVLFCKWLTDSYNSMSSRKKKHQNVLFQLPTEIQWENLASSGKANMKYPWGGPYMRNAKGCYLANIKTSSDKSSQSTAEKCESATEDGAVFPVRADSYFPNDYGLYGMAGNVAEMVNEKGIAKGGSWNTPEEESTIKSKKSYTTPSADIGFRVIMLVK